MDSRGDTRATRARRRIAAAAALSLALACGRPDLELELAEPDFRGGQVSLRVALGSGLDVSSLRIWMDGEGVAAASDRVPGGAILAFEVAPGAHSLAIRANTDDGEGSVWRELTLAAPPPIPELVGTDPAPGGSVSSSAWLRLRPHRAADADALAGLGLACDGRSVDFDADILDDESILVNPAPALPVGAECALAWRGPEGITSLRFSTTAPGSDARVIHDRRQTGSLAPFPDDHFLDFDAQTATGARVSVPLPVRGGMVPALFDALLHEANGLDGWSPLAPIVVEVSEALDPESLPRDAYESLDAGSTVVLFDLETGVRVPVRVDARSDATSAGVSHTLLVSSSHPLEGGRRYALAILRGALGASGAPLAPSDFFSDALGEPAFGEAPEVARTRARIAPALKVFERDARPRVPREDLALLLPLSIRSTDGLAADLRAMRAAVDAGSVPELLGYVVEPEPPESPVAAVVRGTWLAPDWRPLDPGLAPVERGDLVRDADGRPLLQGSRAVGFVLALPRVAADGPVPWVFHQHGNPGDAGEVVRAARSFLADAGFAVVGFTDVLNRDVAPPVGPDGLLRSNEERVELQVTDLFFSLFVNGSLPDHWLQTSGEQLAFLRFASDGLRDLDVLPLGTPDGVPDLDPSAPALYHGVSEGANHGQALLAHAPEIRAAALVAGGARLAEVLLHQQAEAILSQLPAFVPGLLPSDIWVAASLFQSIHDGQDRHNQLRFATGPGRASVLLVEGLDDAFLPNAATESAAFALGLPVLGALRPVPGLVSVSGAVRGNLGGGATGALVQLAPEGLPDHEPTPGCAALPPPLSLEGHFCAQSAAESRRLRADFFRSALGDASPEIRYPLDEE
jgi:hypothetical protein